MTTTHESLQETGRCALASIREMVAALECDYERLEELRDEWEALQEAIKGATEERDTEALSSHVDPDELAELSLAVSDAHEAAKEWQDDYSDELAGLIDAAGDCKDREDAEQRIHEDPLSLEYRSGWVTDKSEMEAEEFCLLLSTGGPAVRIMGELSDGEATRAYLQVQDWGTAWTDYYEQGIGEVLMTYVQCFCFE